MSSTTETLPGVDLKRAALVMIEFQREWLDVDGKLGGMMQDRAQFEAAITGGQRALEAARANGLTVAHVGYSFSPGYPELAAPDHGMDAAIIRYGTFVGRGAEFADGFLPQEGEFVASGRVGVSAFAGSNLDAFLRRKRIDTLFLAGFALQACIESTARQAKDMGYRVYIVEDAVSAFTPEQRQYVFEQAMWMFARTVPSQTLINATLEG